MKVVAHLPIGAYEILKGFAATGTVGEKIEDAATFLLIRALDDLVRTPGFRYLLPSNSKPSKG